MTERSVTGPDRRRGRDCAHLQTIVIEQLLINVEKQEKVDELG